MFIFVTLLPITLYGILLYNKSSEIIQDKVNLSISEALTQISTSINEKIEKVRNELIEGGYKTTTPAAIVYKATWPDEKIMITTVGELVESAKKNKIEKTALIIVGDFLKNTENKSKLYDRNFTHEYRKGESD